MRFDSSLVFWPHLCGGGGESMLISCRLSEYFFPTIIKIIYFPASVTDSSCLNYVRSPKAAPRQQRGMLPIRSAPLLVDGCQGYSALRYSLHFNQLGRYAECLHVNRRSEVCSGGISGKGFFDMELNPKNAK